jgi:Zn-dependent M32 family carboxypeptidase
MSLLSAEKKIKPIVFEFIELQLAVQLACQNHNQSMDNDDYKLVNPQLNDKVKRITINYLRHQSSNYDQLMDQYSSSNHARNNRLAIRKTLFTVISEYYPQLKDQALKQRGKKARFNWPVEVVIK